MVTGFSWPLSDGQTESGPSWSPCEVPESLLMAGMWPEGAVARCGFEEAKGSFRRADIDQPVFLFPVAVGGVLLPLI